MKSRVISLLLSGIASGSLLTAQAQATAPPQTDAAGQITLHVTVDSRSGAPVEGLKATDFTLTDNKKQQPVVVFREVKNQPTKIVVVLDAVNLPYTEVSFARQQLSQFFSANGGKLEQPMTLGILQDSGMQIQPTFTTNGNALRDALDRFGIGLRELPRSTGVYGADERLEISLHMMRSLVAQLPKDGPKRIIWISGGWPLLSGPEVDLNPSKFALIFSEIVAFSTELRNLQVTIDAVNPLGASQDVSQMDYYQNFLSGVRNRNQVQLGDLGLQVLAIQSGGLVLNGSNDIAGLLQRAADQTKDCYEISFVPAPGEHDNEYHQIQLKVDRPGLTVHTTTGYYARPVYSPL